MKFLPTIDLWADGIQAAILSGALKLQRGQWVKCGSDSPSRFVRATRTSIWAVHPQSGQEKKFREICKTFQPGYMEELKRNRREKGKASV